MADRTPLSVVIVPVPSRNVPFQMIEALRCMIGLSRTAAHAGQACPVRRDPGSREDARGEKKSPAQSVTLERDCPDDASEKETFHIP